MSTTVDERVVEMRFDNKQFEQNVQTSLSTLDKLKQSLNLDGAAKGLENVNAAAKNCNMSGLSSAVETVHARFSALEVIAVTALANITNSVINTGKQMLESLTIEPITQGFEEYELKMGSIQTIMMSTGASLEEVNGYLNELNTYADRTIYSFADMTSNIGKFTNAGVELEDAVMAIQGISNEAAVSGANANEASRAMYNFAQALSAGYVKLIDWKSIENANMATVEFKTQLLESAVAAGTLEKTADGMYKVLTTNANGASMDDTISATKNFNDSLSYQWMTTEALVSTLRDYADETTEIGKKAFAAAQEVKTFTQLMDTLKEAVGSGWATTWEIVFGDFNEAKTLWTEASNYFGGIIDSMSDARNSLLKGGLSSGWKQLLDEGISDASGFKEMVSSVAREHGIAIDDMIEKSGSFEDTLKDGWLTSDLLTESISKFTEKISNMSEEELEAAGYTEDQIEELKKLDAAVKDGSISMEEFSEKIGDMSGRENLIQALKNAFSGLVSVVKPIKDGFREIFPKMTSEQLYNMTVVLKEFTSHLKLSDTASANLKSTFKGLFAILDIVKQAFSAVFKAITPLFGGLDDLGGGILSVTGGIGDWLVKLDEFIKQNDIFGKAIQGVIDFVKKLADIFKGFAKEVKDKFNLPDLDTVKESVKDFLNMVKEKIKVPGLELVHTILERIHERMSQVGDAAGNMKSGVITAIDTIGDALSKCKFLQVLQAIWNLITGIVKGIVNALGDMITALVDKLGSANFNGVIDFLNSLALGGLALGINGGISGFLDNLGDTVKKVTSPLEKITGILDGVKECLSSYQKDLQARTLLKIAGAIAILAGAIVAISLIDSDKLSASLGAITVMFTDLIVAMAALLKMTDTSDKASSIGDHLKSFLSSFEQNQRLSSISTSMIKMAASILILAAALKIIASLDIKQLAIGLAGIAGLAVIMGGTIAALQVASNRWKDGKIKGLFSFAVAIGLLTISLKAISDLEPKQLAVGLSGIAGLAVIMGSTIVALQVASNRWKDGKIKGLFSFAVAIGLLTISLKAIANEDWDGIAKGLTGIAGLAIIMGSTIVVLQAASNRWKDGCIKGLLSFAVSIGLLTVSLKLIANESWDSLARGLSGIAGLAVIMGTTIVALEAASNRWKDGCIKGLFSFAVAIGLLTISLKAIANEDWDGIAKGLTGIAGLAVIMGGTLTALTAVSSKFDSASMIKAAGSILVMSAAILVLTPALAILGAMSWESIVKGLVTIAGAFTIMGVAGAVLAPLSTSILALSGAFALIGVGVLAIGAGLLAAGLGLSALAVGFTAFAAALTAGATAVVAGLTVVITGIAGLIPAIVAKIGEAIVEFCKVIAASAPAIGEAIKAVVLTLVNVLVECVPAIADGALALIAGVLEALVNYTPQIVDSIFQFLIKVLEGIAKNLPELIKVAIDVLMSFFAGIADALSGIDVDVLLKGIVGIGLLSAIMIALSAVASLVPGAMVGVLGMGAIIAELALVLAAVGALAQIPGLEWLINEGGDLLQGIGTAIGQFVGGIVGGFMSGVSSQFPQIGSDLSAFMTNVQPFLEGASSIQPSMMDGVKALAETILILTAADILQGLTSWLTGGSSLSGFAEELVPFGQAMKDFSLELAGMDGEVVANAATAGKTLAEMASTLPNSGGVIGFFTGENDMKAFGEQLVPFGEAMMAFAGSIAGLDANAVTEAAIAGKAMAEMATTIPNSGGVVGFFAGENDMKDFGEQLVPFGEAMMNFSQAVSGLNADVIVESATAGKALIELANTIPNTGGVVGFFAGENDMDTFGEQLVPFGKAMKEYSDAVSGIDADAITNSATAGKSLVELANTLPNTGGVVSWFTGDNDIGAFGESLVSFGENFAKYSDYMKTVDAGIVTATTNAATSIVELQKSLPKEGGWFSDDMTLSSFGSDMASFGQHFSTYYGYISGVDTGVLAGVITQTNRLVDMANGMVDMDTSGMSGFSSALTKLGEAGIDGFINAFNNASGRVTTAATTMVTTFSNAAKGQQGTLTTTFTTLVQAVLIAINGKQSEFQTAGSTLMTKFIAGVKSQDSSSRTTFTNIISGCLTAIKNKYGEFQSVGTTAMIRFIAGVRSQDTSARSAFTTIISGCLTVIKNKYLEFESVGKQCMIKFIAGVRSKESEIKTAFTSNLGDALKAIKDYYSQFYDAGSYLVDGFCKGISENTYKAEAKSRAMAKAAAKAAEDELDEHSPSKVGYQIGDYFGVAFVNAIGDYEDKAYKSGSEMASAAKTGLSNAISKIKDFITDGIDTQPTIRPVLDLTNVEAGAGRLSTLLSRTQAMTISAGMNQQDGAVVQNGEESPNAGSTFNFTQNNYSPKSLSRVEIYRQTKNQFSAMERMVKA